MLRRCVTVALITAALTMHAAPAQAADPKVPEAEQIRITRGFGLYLNLWGTEWRWLVTSAMRVAGGGSIAICATAKVPAPHARAAKVACSALGALGVSGVQVLIDKLNSIDSRMLGGMCFQSQMLRNPNIALINWIVVRPEGNCK